ncbi:hypothetical protein [Photorhabdus akhurstii]|uniref:hypothetical protein n=1 Tax=Photorhabdus akhurstii TaxID=171438 RepID=UPI001C2E9EF2
MTLTFVVFALNFLTLWWETARWLGALVWASVRIGDITSMMDQGGHRQGNLQGMFGQVLMRKMLSKGK